MIDPKRGYELWMQIIADEELYEHMIAGTHASIAASRGLDPVDLAMLDELHHMRGTKWNIENLRFRTALEVGDKLQAHLPRTVALLCRGITEWWQDVTFEYMAAQRWNDLGHAHFAECARFVDYVRRRIAQRRALPPHFASVMKFEEEISQLIHSTAAIAPHDWPLRRQDIDDISLANGRPRRAPAVRLIELDEDISDWIHSGDVTRGDVGAEPLVILAFIPSLTEAYKIQKLSEGARYVFELCQGELSTVELAAAIEAEDVGLEAPGIIKLIRRWVIEGILELVPRASSQGDR